MQRISKQKWIKNYINLNLNIINLIWVKKIKSLDIFIKKI